MGLNNVPFASSVLADMPVVKRKDYYPSRMHNAGVSLAGVLLAREQTQRIKCCLLPMSRYRTVSSQDEMGARDREEWIVKRETEKRRRAERREKYGKNENTALDVCVDRKRGKLETSKQRDIFPSLRCT